jgi:uncharacterized iron-regulated protein
VITLFPAKSPFSLLFISLCLFFLTGLPSLYAEPASYHLDISITPDQSRLTGRATVQIPAGKEWHFSTTGLSLTSISLKVEGSASFAMPLPQEERISLYASSKAAQLTIDYSLSLTSRQRDNLIDSQAIVLTSNWHPVPKEPMLFSLNAQLPQGFLGISESDQLPSTRNGLLQTSFSRAVRSIHLAAAPYEVQSEEIRQGLTLSIWFFKEDRDLSQGYMDATKAYILRYEQEIGPFPYTHYAVVANRLPSGYGMPTFSLLGQMLLRLPFIKGSSLGHEVLHSWFGNSIKVAETSGNWCEGLTSYLADFSYATDRGEGVAHRKAALLNFQSYVHQSNTIALKDFGSASHSQAMARTKRSVGYGRSAMLFHELRGLIGPEHFFQGLRDFASSYRGKSASWQDIQAVFEKVSGKELQQFFSQRLQRRDIPSLTLGDIRTETIQDGAIIHFTIVQDSKQPFSLQVPIRITFQDGHEDFRQVITEPKTDVSLTLKEIPLSVTIDPEYDLFRTLSPEELPPVWSRFLGAEKKLVVIVDTNSSKAFVPMIQMATEQGWPTIKDEDVSNEQLAENSILFLGNGKAAMSIRGTAADPAKGFQLDSSNNPLSTREVVIFMSSSDVDETRAALPKLKHYGKYSQLSFLAGKVLSKRITDSSNGISYTLETLPQGVAANATRGFSDMVAEIAKSRVIYLGETHNSLADHLLQLRIIQALHSQGLDLAIAMEMFPASSQQALDTYILQEQKDMTEEKFLKSSRWFKVWRYDWRLFRPIFSFLRANRIPVYGINIQREIVSEVFTAGNTDTLSPEQRESIAKERDLLMDGYVERLEGIYGFHAQTQDGPRKKISGFIQSQALWDESMAKNIADILHNNPNKTLIVIAGSQHTRKDSGIPPRVLRRISVSQTSAINIYGNNAPANPNLVADWFFLANEVYLAPQGKIGVLLSPEEDADGTERLRITGFSPTGKAQEAGIQKDDIILSINGEPAANMDDVGILMMDSRAGDTLVLTVQRKDQTGTLQEKEISVILSNLSKPAIHP